MTIVGVLIFIVLTVLPGLLLVRLLRNSNLSSLNTILYAAGLGLVFNIAVGMISNYTFGIKLFPVAMVYLSLLSIVGLLSWKYGKRLPLKWIGWKPIVIPVSLYILAVSLQLQTTMVSSNLIGSDIHLEYFVTNRILELGAWNPIYLGTTLNTCIGLVMLLPVYKLLTGLSLLMVYKLLCPLVYAVLPLVLYRIFKVQFGTVIAVLSVVFFITLPMFTMDMVQLIRQQQSELFFVLAILLLMDNNLRFWQKALLGAIFSAGAVSSHIGMAIGSIGYWVSGGIVVFVLARLWRGKIADAIKPRLPKFALLMVAVMSIVAYVGWYGWVYNGTMLTSGAYVPVMIVERSVKQVVSGIEGISYVEDENVVEPTETVEPIVEPTETVEPTVVIRPFLERFPLINPFLKEPLAQTALGLDFGKASMLGKAWRVLQYLVELCLVVGFFILLFRPPRRIRIEYASLMMSSFFIIAGMYLLTNHGWGLGAIRVFQITLLFMSPLFVIGCSTIGSWVTKLKVNKGKLVICSTLILLIPYLIFNSGTVYEVAKLGQAGFIDVPYSIALSGQRVDITTVFDKEDIEAVDWLKALVDETDDTRVLYGDNHGAKLLCQYFGFTRHGLLDTGDITFVGYVRSLEYINPNDGGYIFLRKLNVDNNMLTYMGGYASSVSYGMDEDRVQKARERIESGTIVFDNGARIILVEDD